MITHNRVSLRTADNFLFLASSHYIAASHPKDRMLDRREVKAAYTLNVRLCLVQYRENLHLPAFL
jgi:hypothetical protein